jgi:cobalt/nickel transport system permease protein
MQPIHLAIGLGEGLITGAVLVFIAEARPELLWGCGEDTKKEGRLSYKSTLVVLGVTAVVIGGLLSLLASSYPDGLEWSMERIAGTTELEAQGGIYSLAEGIQSATSLLPDYAWKNSESVTGTMFSGVLGGVVVACLCVAVCCLLKFFRKKMKG